MGRITTQHYGAIKVVGAVSAGISSVEYNARTGHLSLFAAGIYHWVEAEPEELTNGYVFDLGDGRGVRLNRSQIKMKNL